ncbi:MAG TPA: hypothetical protein VK217_04615, partial [Acidimicrobiales bacterium]|nr:hypothetical protein [Acidimicrobiales bacterium]
MADKKTVGVGWAGLLTVVLVACLVPASIAGATRSLRTTRTAVHAATASEASCTTGIPVMSRCYFDKKNVSHGFIYEGGKFTTIDDPSATTNPKYAGTSVYGVTSGGTLGGQYYDSKGVSHGFPTGRASSPHAASIARLEPAKLLAKSDETKAASIGINPRLGWALRYQAGVFRGA